MTPEEIDQLVAENVRAARARRRLRQEDLADEMGWSRPTVSALEAGTRRVTVADAAALCIALGIDLRELLRGADEDVVWALGLETSACAAQVTQGGRPRGSRSSGRLSAS
jgi:transcriptional regulator with XRE-family HTH domain